MFQIFRARPATDAMPERFILACMTAGAPYCIPMQSSTLIAARLRDKKTATIARREGRKLRPLFDQR
jgi:hypothetical protein